MLDMVSRCREYSWRRPYMIARRLKAVDRLVVEEKLERWFGSRKSLVVDSYVRDSQERVMKTVSF
jgi:hypothetical protein